MAFGSDMQFIQAACSTPSFLCLREPHPLVFFVHSLTVA